MPGNQIVPLGKAGSSLSRMPVVGYCRAVLAGPLQEKAEHGVEPVVTGQLRIAV